MRSREEISIQPLTKECRARRGSGGAMRRFMLILLVATGMAGVARSEAPEGMVEVPGGRFAMGVSELELELLAQLGEEVPHMDHHCRGWFAREMPLHEVEVRAFYLDAKEVRNADFARFVVEAGYVAEGNWREWAGEGREEHPVVGVSWKDAQAYASWAGKRLPTEAEWEWAARGGSESRWFPWGDASDDYKHANYGHDRSFWGGVKGLIGLQRIKTVPTGGYEPNGYGLHDMQGNAAEWCADDLLPYPGGPRDAHPFEEPGYHERPWKSLRGGSWRSPNPVYVRSNHRGGRDPDRPGWTTGFRCARDLGEDSAK